MRFPRSLAIAAAVFVVVAVGGLFVERHFRSTLEPLGAGSPAPEFTATTLDAPRRARSLADYKGQVVLLNVWATWCEPCRVEMPSIERLYRAYGPRGLRVVAISIDDAGTDRGIRQFAHDMGLSFEVLHDSTGAIQHTYETTGVPETVVIGRDGIIRKKVASAIDWDSDGNRRLIERLLAE